MRRLRVAVLFGGRSAEHEISILSARFVLESLDRERFQPLLVGIDKTGRWLLQEEALLLGQSRDPRLVRLNASAPAAQLAPFPGGRASGAIEVAGGAALDVDVVFPVLHGPMGEDGTMQGLLTLADVPFVGSGVLGSAAGMDKDVMKRLLRGAGLPVVPHSTVRAAAWQRDRAGALDQACLLAGSGPVFVKPANLGSSVGVSKATGRAEIASAVDEALGFDDKVVIEGAVAGVRELECAVLGDDDPVASRVGEVIVSHPDGFYSYAAKYVDEHGATTVIPAALEEGEEQRIRRLAIDTFMAIGCEGLARVDFFRSQDGRIFVNELNTMPGFTSISMYPKLFEASGIGARELVSRLIALALARAERRRKLRTSYG